MKKFFKNLTLSICAVSVSAMILTASVTALASSEGFRSGPGEAASVTDTVTTGSSNGQTVNTSVAVSEGSSANDVTSQAVNSSASVNRKYLTKLGGFFWFLLSVIVNFILSCWIGNRFYHMAKKSAQGSSEIRALRKDIEEKFASTLSDIDEPAVEVLNRNESYARADEGVAMPERRSHVELNDDEIEVMRRWDSKRTAAKATYQERIDDYEEELEEYGSQPRKMAKRSYQPTRRSSGIEFDDNEYDEDNTSYEGAEGQRRSKPTGEVISNAKNKARDFLSNVFPFDE